MRRSAVACLIAATTFVCFVEARHVHAQLVTAEHGMVVSVSGEATDVGVEVLKRGGNSVDAAVATAFALAVTHPAAGNLGGGGFMIVYPGGGADPVCIDYRETAPAAATPDMLPPEASSFGPRIVGVPGTVRGLALAHRRFGRLEWRPLVAPAIRLADEGFMLSDELARSLNSLVRKSPEFPELQRVYGKDGGREQWQAGDRFVQPDLARTLRAIADEGPDAFYQGRIAEQIVAEMQAGDGLITAADLAGYRAKVRTPIHGTYHDYDVYGPPPPSSGGICLVEMLNILENFDLDHAGGLNSADTLHLMIESMRRAYCDRARYLGDSDFVDVPERLTSKEYGRQLAAGIDLAHATPSEQLAPEIQLAAEGTDTTHFSVVDSRGMAVSNTYTLEFSFGSRVVVRGAGFLLNNEMGDFNRQPGHTDRNGAIGTPANVIAPGKRMLSSQTPVVVAKDGRAVLVTGSPGGRTIINTVLCVLLARLEFGLNVREAVDAPRVHHQWFPDVAQLEKAPGTNRKAAAAILEARGHTLRLGGSGRQGDAHSIAIVDGVLQGAADHRSTTSLAAGY